MKATHPGTRPRPRARTLARLIRFLGRRSSVTGQAQAGRHPDNYQTEIRSVEIETFPGPFRGVIAVLLTGTTRTDPIDRQLGGSSRSTRPAAECRTGRVLRCPILLPAPGSRNERTHPSFSLGCPRLVRAAPPPPITMARGGQAGRHDGSGALLCRACPPAWAAGPHRVATGSVGSGACGPTVPASDDSRRAAASGGSGLARQAPDRGGAVANTHPYQLLHRPTINRPIASPCQGLKFRRLAVAGRW